MGKMVPGQPVDPYLDIGGPLPNYHDQAEVVVCRPHPNISEKTASTVRN